MSAPIASDTAQPSAAAPDPRRIFLSGSTADFGDARLKLREALARGGCHVIHEADFPQTQAGTVLKLAGLVAPCGVLIHLIGTQPGSVPGKANVDEYLTVADKGGAFLKAHPGLRASLGDFSGLTYTQWEALIALHLGIALLIYADRTHGEPAHPQRLHLDFLLGVDKHPSPFTDATELYMKVMADLLYHYGQIVPAAELPEIFRSGLHQLPPRPSGFVGREADLAKLRALNPAAGAVLTGLRGMGGIGKTALALVLAHEWAARFPDAQLFLDAFGTRTQPDPPSARQLMEQVVLAFHPTAKLPDDPAVIAGIYRDVLGGKKVLILLDNALDAAQAKPLIPPAGCALIVTSRHSFMLGTVKPHDVGRLPDAEAVALLREFAPDLTEAEAAALVPLCAGLPLALRLAGAHLALDAAERNGPPDFCGYILALGGGRLATLDAEAADAGEVTISETLRLSEAQLPEGEREAWRKLGVFTASFDARAAEAIAGASEEMLRHFVRRSLLEREGAERFKLHDLAADYARGQLTDTARTGLHLAHARHYTAVGDEADTIYLKGDPVSGLALFDRERTQIETAYTTLATRTDEAAAHQLILLVNSMVHTGQRLRFNPRQRIAWLESQIHAAHQVKHRLAEVTAIGNLGVAYLDLGDARTALGYIQQRLTTARETRNRSGECAALANLGVAYRMLGDTSHALQCFEKQLIIARETNDRRSEGSSLGNLGNAHLALGNAGKAVRFYERHLAIAREIHDLREEGSALGNLGGAHRELGDACKAIEYHEQQLVVTREIGDRRGEGNALGNLGSAYYSFGDVGKAIGFYEKSFVIYREIGDRNAEGSIVGNLGNAYYSLGDARKAMRYYERCLTITREIGDRRGEGNTRWNAALAHDFLGDRPEAIAQAVAALAIREAIEDPNAAQVRAKLAEWRGEP
jgi:tetratricopeptide (TPR) repeat protein